MRLLLTTTLLLGTSIALGDAGGRHFKASLSGYQEVPTVSTSGEGEVDLRVNSASTEISYTLSYSGLEGGAAVAAHIHLGQRGTNGGVSAFFCGGGGKPPCPPVSGSVSGTIVAADIIGPASQGIAAGQIGELLRAMRAGVTYANVHTAPMWPGGEIRGQIRDKDEQN